MQKEAEIGICWCSGGAPALPLQRGNKEETSDTWIFDFIDSSPALRLNGFGHVFDHSGRAASVAHSQAFQTMGQESIVIVGAGIFGASSALHLSRAQHSCSIKLFDRGPFPSPKAASYDINKMVRAAYGDIAYCRLGARSLSTWRADPLFKRWYHPSGMLFFLPQKGAANKTLENLKGLGFDDGAEIVTPEQVRQRFDGIFQNANFGEAEELLWDPHVGWLNAADALAGTIQVAIDNGVEYIPDGVSRLIIDDGVCRGVETSSGKRYEADKVLLSAGAETARLLADSAPHQPDLHAAGRFVAAAIIVAKVKLTDEQIRRYKVTPAVGWDAEPVKGEVMPLTEDGYLKFIRDIPVKNTLLHRASNSSISIPPTEQEGTEWTDPKNLPQTLQDEMAVVIEGIFGPAEAAHMQPDKLRLCWEPMAPDENWFITPHTKCKALYVATAGTGHAWKFLPIIGELIVEMMLAPDKFQQNELSKRWAWDRKLVDSPDPDIIPQRELADLT